MDIEAPVVRPQAEFMVTTCTTQAGKDSGHSVREEAGGPQEDLHPRRGAELRTLRGGSQLPARDCGALENSLGRGQPGEGEGRSRPTGQS